MLSAKSPLISQVLVADWGFGQVAAYSQSEKHSQIQAYLQDSFPKTEQEHWLRFPETRSCFRSARSRSDSDELVNTWFSKGLKTLIRCYFDENCWVLSLHWVVKLCAWFGEL